eukprot:scaffold87854_cov62-Phaeocystis_antarctica.AAC.2
MRPRCARDAPDEVPDEVPRDTRIPGAYPCGHTAVSPPATRNPTYLVCYDSTIFIYVNVRRYKCASLGGGVNSFELVVDKAPCQYTHAPLRSKAVSALHPPHNTVVTVSPRRLGQLEELLKSFQQTCIAVCRELLVYSPKSFQQKTIPAPMPQQSRAHTHTIFAYTGYACMSEAGRELGVVEAGMLRGISHAGRTSSRWGEGAGEMRR